MAYPYIDRTHVENRLSPAVVLQIFDDSSVGEVSQNPIDQLCLDASSVVAGFLRPVYDLAAIAANPPHEVVRLSTDVAEAYAARRFPTVVRRDWEKLMNQAERDLQRLRDGTTRLDVVGSPEPSSANVAAVVNSSPRRGW